MRLAVVSDIHGNLPALEAVVRDFTRRSVDAVINLGDSLSGPLLPLETAQFLMAQSWTHLAGNHERQILTSDPNPSDAFARAQLGEAELAWMTALKPSAQFDQDVLLCHGTPTSDHQNFLETVEPTHIRPATSVEVEERLGDVTAKLVLCGHTHLPRCVRSARGSLIVNPGSVGLPAYEGHHPHFHLVQNGSPEARYALVERQQNGFVASLIAVPYDHEKMARLAHERARDDWARALASGYA